MRKLMSTLAIAALFAGMSASAHATEGWYVRGDVGYSVDGQVDAEFNDGEENFSATADLDNDWMAAGGVGYAYGNGFRTEAELAYRNNEITDLSGADVEAKSVMINGFYDFNRAGRFQPYLGVGVGYAEVDAGAANDSNWAWQAMAGVGAALSDRLTLDVGYRFFRVDDLQFGPITNANYEHQAVTVGLRYQLGAPAAAPVAEPTPAATPAPEPMPTPAPVACPTSEFTVYFEWDRSNLNDAAMATIDQAVARARECNVTGTVIVGHTDTSGSTAYNIGLSERRASVVRDALVARGMAGASMSMQARGESELARQTPDGVREPLNRRTAVTITFH